MSLSQAVAAPSPVVLASKEYVATPLDAFKIGELEEYARARILSISSKAADEVPGPLGDRILDRALKLATATDFASEEFNRYLMSKRGMETMLSLSLRERHPDMTPRAVGLMMKDRGAELVTAIGTILRISGLAGDDSKAGQKPGEGDGGEAGASPPSSK
jgi:hypothetical protein